MDKRRSLTCLFPITILGILLLINVRRLWHGYQLTSALPLSPDAVDQVISECSCKRKFLYPPSGATHRLESTCSDEGSQYKSGQKVVAFSLYFVEDNDVLLARQKDVYRKGLELNLNKIRSLYKGYVMRVYTNVQLDKNSNADYCKLVCSNSDLFWCNIHETPGHGDLSAMFLMTWRFLPLGDPTVDLFLSRDMDSVISEREAAAVEDWLTLDKPFHVMRDRQGDHFANILGGLWGARNSLLGSEAKDLQAQIIEVSQQPTRQTKGADQDIVTEVIYFPNKSEFVAYDSYHCEHFSKQMLVRPFPKPRKDANDFAGNPFLGGGNWTLQRCPLACRPPYGKDWEYC